MKQPQFGQLILKIRGEKNITQQQLADLCKVDIRTIQRIECGDVIPRAYTINLLSKALQIDFSIHDKIINQQQADITPKLLLSYKVGIVFSINYLFVIYNIITRSSNAAINTLTIAINILAFIYFVKGFYHLGKRQHNNILAISTIAGMVIVSVENIIYLFKAYYISFAATSLLYNVMCANAIVSGIGFLIAGNKNNENPLVKQYTIAGIVTIIQSALLLSVDFRLQLSGLIISAFTNLLMLNILRIEGKPPAVVNHQIKLNLTV